MTHWQNLVRPEMIIFAFLATQVEASKNKCQATIIYHWRVKSIGAIYYFKCLLVHTVLTSALSEFIFFHED